MPPDKQWDLAAVSTLANYNKQKENVRNLPPIWTFLVSFDLKLEYTTKHKRFCWGERRVFITNGHLQVNEGSVTSQYWVDASPNTTAFTVLDNRGKEGAEHVMKPGAACRLRQQSFPFFPRDNDGALAHL